LHAHLLSVLLTLTMKKHEKDYFQVALSTSMVVFCFDGEKLNTLIGSKAHEPFVDAPTLPTSWVKPDEDVDDVVRKVLQESLGEKAFYVEQLTAFAKLYRQPEGRVVNIAQYCLVDYNQGCKPPKKGFKWVAVAEVPMLVYDHNEIFQYAMKRLKRRFKRRPIAFRLLPEEFTLNEIHGLYEQALGKELDKRNFRKKFLKSELLTDLDKTVKIKGSKKPASLYAFNQKRYDKRSLKGYDFVF
jgi:8-oxo-dGTP diphosphatase